MSVQLIQQYHAAVDRKIRYGGSSKESAVRNEFYNLVQQYARPRNLEFVPEINYRLPGGSFVTPDGTLKDALRQDWGYWEAKDTSDDLDVEIANKQAKGYPNSNILYEDTQTAVLIQAGEEVGRVTMLNAAALDALLGRFVSYESREVRAFREAIERFKEDVPALAETLRDIIRTQYEKNARFRKEAALFLELAQEAINPAVELADVREMLIQHILTQDIFNRIFDDPHFHQENAIARELGGVVGTFYTGTTRRTIDAKMSGYYEAINARAAAIYDHHEKQRFLKVLYETFYKAYNPKGADRLGIVYTPNEIVRFMIEGADWLCHKHFGRTLGDENVHILDPATGTGTFITEILDYLPPQQLPHKYRHELHCNEVAILPYYIANLNIEYTYQQITGQYEPFEHIVFVDTLDNMGFAYAGKQMSLFGLVDENAARIKAQNERDISVIIGNPPYNAWQENFNQQNANRPYKEVDERIKQTYIKHGTAQNQIGVYDMYSRFYRWASDRLGDEGIIAFITNSSFIDGRIFDGFRKLAAEEFSDIYVIDLGGNIRKNPKLSGPKHNVFAIQTGVAIAFMVRRNVDQRDVGATHGSPLPAAHIHYARRPEMEEASDKLRFLATTRLRDVSFKPITPSKRHNWINQTDNDFDDLLPLISKDVKAGDSQEAVFRLFSRGVATQRDEWVYDFSAETLERKVRFLIDTYEASRKNPDYANRMQIKWDRELTKYRDRQIEKQFNSEQLIDGQYRPFVKMRLYSDLHFNGMTYQLPNLFPIGRSNAAICFTDSGSEKPFMTIAAEEMPDLHLVGAGCSAQCMTLNRFDDLGNRVDNITDWALAQFRGKYEGGSAIPHPKSEIKKRDIFHYVYAVLHHPAYRQKYELNLKRDFPRIPFYADFWQWATWGARLMDLHLHYETVDPYPLDRHDADPDTVRKAYRAKLSANTAQGVITLDTYTMLSGVPDVAWTYRLGNRSALEWILDRYKERKPRDPTIREKFNTYRFADYKEHVIDLLCRVTTVSVETMAIVNVMPASVEEAL
ncbi:MAG: N-6 DNA methylase [Anaerolineae bacterium]|nr:N-6 DNA methylase [Anaerolineae bacterium]MCO5195694.1 N-6 DNA methylase [Anaerolineae bacterium]MCO5205756.1 N-6 DNA methylase [Anaerolineae bacterium]